MTLIEELNYFFSKFDVTLEEARKKLKGIALDDWAYDLKGTLQHLYFAMVSVALKDVKNVLELGTGLGETTAILSGLFPMAKIYTLDVPRGDGEFRKRAWRNLPQKKDGKARFRENIGKENIVYINRNSFFLSSMHLPEKFEAIFVDGGHIYPAVAWDIMYAYHHLQKGGFMFMHDYSIDFVPKQSRVKSVLDYLASRIKEEILLFPGSPNLKRNKIIKIPCIRKGYLKS